MIRNNTTNFAAQPSGANKPDLPVAGAYPAIIKGARVEDTPWGGQRLVLALDITEGEYAGRYQDIFDFDKKAGSYQAKWRGTFRQNIPTGDGSEKDSWTQRSLEGTVWALEQSNPGYTWDWDETKLIGKRVGISVRNKEWEYNDLTGWTTEIGRLESLEDVKAGKVKPMRDKPLNNTNQGSTAAPATADASGFTPVETSELPF